MAINSKDESETTWMYEGEGVFFTVFPDDPKEMPQDFPNMKEAEEYGDENFGSGNYTIEHPF